MKPAFLKKRTLFSLFAVLLSVGALVAFLLVRLFGDQNAFQSYCKNYVINQLQSNTLDLHYTLANPSAFNLPKRPVSLPVYQPGDALSEDDKTAAYIEKLEQIDAAALTKDQQQTYYVLDSYLKELMVLEAYDYMSEPLSPSSGIHTTFPILLAEYTFRGKTDVEDYLTLLSQSGDYILGILQYQQEKSAAGLFMSPHAAKTVVDACYDIMDSSLLEEGKHFLLTSFTERLEPLVAEGVINASEALSFQAENDRLVTTVLAPAYIALADGILVLENTGNDSGGLCTYEGGQAYYQALIQRNTGSDKSVSEIKTLLLERFQSSYSSLLSLLIERESLMEQSTYTSAEALFPMKDPVEILAYLKDQMTGSFPLCEETAVTVKQISPNLQDYFSPAFYLTPPLDDFSQNVIYINEKNALAGIGLFTTLAHEGYPGHLYQSVYFQEHLSGGDSDGNSGNSSDSELSGMGYDTIVRNMLYHGGYTEGWAMYVETLSYEYAKELVENDSICDALRLESEMQLSLYCLLDIAIHYDGATYEQIEALLKSFGITDKTAALSVYNYLIEEPTTYMKYYLGYLEILELKELAKTLWGTEYSDQRFHTFFLEAGPSSFAYLRQQLL